MITCPFCNALVSFADPKKTGERVTCPRCAETFSLLTDWVPDAISQPSEPPPVAPEKALSGKFQFIGLLGGILWVLAAGFRMGLPRNHSALRGVSFFLIVGGMLIGVALWAWFFRKKRTNGATIWFLLANMLFMAAVVLPFALWTTSYRRDNDLKKGVQKQEIMVKPAERFHPAGMISLGWLPPDVNVVAGIQVRELLQTKEGRTILEALGQPLVSAWTSAGGHPWTDYDEIALGSKLNGELPTLYLVGRLTKASPDLVPERLVKKVTLKPIGEGTWFRADVQTHVMLLRLDAVKPQDLDAIPPSPRPSKENLASPLRALLSQRLPAEAVLWIAGTPDPKNLQALVQTFLPPEVTDLVRGMTAFSCGLVPGESVTIQGQFQLSSREEANRLADWLEKNPPEKVASFRVFRQPEGAEAGNWVGLQLRADENWIPFLMKPQETPSPKR